VVVCVVAPPDAHAGGAVEAQVFPGAREGFEAADGFGVLPPLRAPLGHSGLGVEGSSRFRGNGPDG
jgi:hypothetical protein